MLIWCIQSRFNVLINNLTNNIQSGVLEKLLVSQLLKKFPAFYGT